MKAHQRNNKLPSGGRPLAERQRFENPPGLVVVCVGLDSWRRAEEWAASPNDVCSMVLEPGVNPGALEWPVAGCWAVIDWWVGPRKSHILSLVKVLLMSGASRVISYPSEAIDSGTWVFQYNTDACCFVQCRETFETFKVGA